MPHRNLVVPTVNLNGNPADDLVERLRGVIQAIKAAQESMANASDVIHGRNFQLAKDPDEMRDKAQLAWSERYVMLEKLHKEILDLALAIQEQKR